MLSVCKPEKSKLSDDFKELLVNCFNVETVSALEELVKKVLKNHRNKEYSGKAYRKLIDNSKDIAEELEKKIQKGKIKKVLRIISGAPHMSYNVIKKTKKYRQDSKK